MLAILAALRQEIRDYVGPRGFSETAREGGTRFYQSPAARDVVVVEGGVGRTRAEKATRQTVERFRPDLIVSAGFAGAVKPGLSTSDLILCDRVWAAEGPCPNVVFGGGAVKAVGSRGGAGGPAGRGPTVGGGKDRPRRLPLGAAGDCRQSREGANRGRLPGEHRRHGELLGEPDGRSIRSPARRGEVGAGPHGAVAPALRESSGGKRRPRRLVARAETRPGEARGDTRTGPPGGAGKGGQPDARRVPGSVRIQAPNSRGCPTGRG